MEWVNLPSARVNILYRIIVRIKKKKRVALEIIKFYFIDKSVKFVSFE